MIKKAGRLLSVLLITAVFMAGCGGTEKVEEQRSASGSGARTETQEKKGNAMNLKDAFAEDFKVGVAVNPYQLNDKETSALICENFNSITMENAMKPEGLLDQWASEESKDGMPEINKENLDEVLGLAKEKGLSLRGHCLVWHNQTPEWFFKKNYDEKKGYVSKKVMEKRMENYIKGVLTYCQENYPGVVYCWDVVNECVDDGAGDTSVDWNCRSSFNGGDNFWYATMGTDYVEKAFEFARKYADPEVKLIYNDYNVYMPLKMESIYNLVKGLKEKNLIDGIGLQPTVDLYSPDELSGDSYDSFENCLKKYAELDLDIQITELSFKIDEDTGERDEKSLKRQADRYQEMFELLKKMDTAGSGPCNITSVTVFGICDDYPLYDDLEQCLYLWDKDCKAKEAFYRIREVGEK